MYTDDISPSTQIRIISQDFSDSKLFLPFMLSERGENLMASMPLRFDSRLHSDNAAYLHPCNALPNYPL